MTMLNAYLSYLKTLGTATLAMTFFAGVAGCGSETPVDVSRNLMQAGLNQPAECEGLRVQLRNQVMTDLGLDRMSRKMGKISNTLSPKKRNELITLARLLDRPGLTDEMRDRFVGDMHTIYTTAIARAGSKVRKSERLLEIGRKVTTGLTTGYLNNSEVLAHGNMILLTSSLLSGIMPKSGDFIEIYLVVTPDQNRHEFVMMRAPMVLPGPNSGYNAPDQEQLTLDEHVQSLMPANCR